MLQSAVWECHYDFGLVLSVLKEPSENWKSGVSNLKKDKQGDKMGSTRPGHCHFGDGQLIRF